MIAGLSDIGRENAAFARRVLPDEGIPCVAESLGGTRARRIPTTAPISNYPGRLKPVPMPGWQERWSNGE
jgi:hypothetical protein